MAGEKPVEEPSPELLQVQGLIWIHSLVGAGVGLAFFWSAAWNPQTEVLCGILACSLGWLVSLAPIARKAESLRPEHRRPAKGVPLEVLGVWAAAEICSFAVMEGRGWIFVGHLLIGGTILLRGALAMGLDVPIHRRTWIGSLAVVGGVLVGRMFLAVWSLGIGG